MLNIVKHIAIGATLAGALAVTAVPAQAEYGRKGAFAAGAVGGLVAGAAIAGAASQPRSYYSGPAQFDVYDSGPQPGYYQSAPVRYDRGPGYDQGYAVEDEGYVQQCRIERRQVFIDQARYRWERVRVCN